VTAKAASHAAERLDKLILLQSAMSQFIEPLAQDATSYWFTMRCATGFA
jgi:hypothetical protein